MESTPAYNTPETNSDNSAATTGKRHSLLSAAEISHIYQGLDLQLFVTLLLAKRTLAALTTSYQCAVIL